MARALKLLGWGATLSGFASVAVAMNSFNVANWRGASALALDVLACFCAWAQGRYTTD